MIVVTHWENSINMDERAFLEILHNALPSHSNLGQYIRDESLFYTQFPVEPLRDIEQFIVDLAMLSKWSEKIPYEWKCLNQEISSKRSIKRILPFPDVCRIMPVKEYDKIESTKDMLRYYHDAGKVLYFNENGLNEYVIIYVQWFVDAFKIIITDANHVKGIDAFKLEWDEFYSTGNMKSNIQSRIWKKEDEKLLNRLRIENKVQIEKDGPRFLSYHKNVLLSYMQRLGLISVGGGSHYVPCMNKRGLVTNRRVLLKTRLSGLLYWCFCLTFYPTFFSTGLL
ncbi:uncharacterized protein LOC134264287 [Saccostrea cucullata]|uniref:uncharacterized protein LOC134264287 n=1 Tax=Saccostrea cuccullata TaxID=36930 RepID=UPI002ED571FE